MKYLKIFLAILIAVVLIIGGGVFIFLQSLKPSYEGELTLPGLKNQVSVNFDGYGIPHIRAENEEDLFYAFGYVHAQDRLWQMELLRRIAPGRLAEIFGPDLVETDVLLRTFGINAYSEDAVKRSLQTPDAPYVKMSQAYLKGVNAFMANGATPIEYTILGLEKTPFNMVDIENVMGYMAFSFAMAQRTDPLLSKIASTHGEAYLHDLDVHVNPSTTLIPNFDDQALGNLSASVSRVMRTLPVAPWIGSNGWIVGPEKSASGAVLFSNDPHIAYAQPTIWYEAHLSIPGWEMYGHYLALQPFAALMLNRSFAIGLTMFENDDIDFYALESDENGYRYNGQNVPFASRKEVIQVKGEADTIIYVKSSSHGPIVSGILDDLSEKKQVAMWWTYLKEPSKLQATMYGMGKSSGLEEVRSHVSNIHAPGLNVMYGDAKGNIAWWAAAKLPVRPDHVNSKMVLDGSKSADEPIGYLEFSQNPQAVNPPWNYVSNANNQPDSINGALYPGYYLPDTRAKRIVELLEAEDKLDVAYYKSMLLDNQSIDAKTMAREIYRVLIPVVEDAQMLNRLNDWEGTFGGDEAVPLLFNALIYHIFELGMSDELEDSFTDFSSTHLFKRSMLPLCMNNSSIWWDNVKTPEKEDRTSVFKQAYLLSVSSLEAKYGDYATWKWKNVHTMEHPHPLGQVALLRKIFNVGPFGIGGSNEVLDNQMFILNGEGEYPVLAGPSTRRIIDFADLDHTLSILPTGQSGNLMSPHYKDQAELFAEGKFRLQLINWEEIESETESVLYFVPE